MPAFALTAAEIAAAEAAAIAAAEAAAIQAAQVAAAEAAAQAAATAAAEQAAAQAATQAATQTATTSGIQTLAQEVAASPPTGIETLNMGQIPVTGQVPTGIETLNLGQAPVTGPAPGGMSQAQYDFLHNSTASTDPAAVGEIIKSFPSVAPPPPPAPTLPSLGGPGTGYQGNAVQIGSGSNATPYTPAELQIMQGSVPSPAQEMAVNPLYQFQGPANPQGLTRPPLNEAATFNLTGAQPAAKPGMVEEFMNMSLPNKLLTGMMGATGYEMLNKPKPKEEEKYKSTFKPGLYTGYTPVQPTPYQPRYAVGGIADLGGYSDYARGGRLLKGPGDGMSDDIPATIANKQPARLANEEFVVPADVVSHLGNGSSEAGAKVLYKMMERVRKARTGNKKQGKQINPDKYLA